MEMELAQYIQKKGTMTEWASAVVNKKQLTAEQVQISEMMDKFGKKVANSGVVNDTALSDYLQRVVEEEVYNEPSELLDTMFEQGSLGEFDAYGAYGIYKNTLLAQESAIRGGSIDKSYVDFKKITPVSKHLQLETEVKYEDLRRDGALTIAQLTLYAIEALQNKKFQTIFNHINGLLVSGDNVIDASTSGLTIQSMDDFAGYIDDNSNSGNTLIVGLSTALRGIKNMAGYVNFLSDISKDKLNMGCGILEAYNGVPLASIKAGKKLADGSTLLPKDRLFGFSDKIGKCDTRGKLRVYQNPNNSREVLELKFTGFEFVFAIEHLEKLAIAKLKNN